MRQNRQWKKQIEGWYSKDYHIGFIDEVGTGAISGALYSCCVTLHNSDFYDKQINDSKLIKKDKMCTLSDIIKSNVHEWKLGIVTVEEINKIQNIHVCRLLSFKRTIDNLKQKPDIVLIDGSWKIKDLDIEQHAIIKGDMKVFGIACASIIAKCERDTYMKELHQKYPEYDWQNNKGYRSPNHIKALKEHGVTDQHRLFYKDVIKYGGR